MSKTAFIFPGQGAQYVGMGKDFYEQYPVAKEVFELASKVTGIDVAKLCFEENEDINITEYTQLAMLTTEVAILKVAEQKGLKADCAAGLSLGEYGALAASEVMELADLFALIRKRGIYMRCHDSSARYGCDSNRENLRRDRRNRLDCQLQLSRTDRHHRGTGCGGEGNGSTERGGRKKVHPA